MGATNRLRPVKRLLLVLLVCALALPALAAAASVPSVHRADAEELGGRALRQDYPGWVKRDSGYLDCAGGKVDRTHWSCKVRWVHGRECKVGHLQVFGERFVNGQPRFGVHIQGRYC